MQILAIDQGTSSSRAILFDAALRPLASAQADFPQYFPQPGWVEHDPEEIWASVLATCREVIGKAGDLQAIGITNQRETVVIWDRRTGQPIHNALVWQDRRSAESCAQLKREGLEPLIRARTGLLLDPYFSATKAAWLLDTLPGARAAAEAGHLAMGTIDCFLIWRLTGGRVHATDATNAARTLLYDLHRADWDSELCRLLRIPEAILPEIRDCTAGFGSTETALFGRPLPILGVAGDQQAAAIGQACFRPGMMKSTYGTGCFALLNTGTEPVTSQNRLLTTLAWRIGGESHFALEGSIFIAGAVVQWLRDAMGLIGSAAETQGLAEASQGGLILVPAFTGLGAPWWVPEARGAIYGLTRDSTPADFARAALESVGFQSADLHAAMRADWAGHGGSAAVLRVDGGMSASAHAMQFLADMIAAPVERPAVLEATATGAAWLAGQAAGISPGMDAFAAAWQAEARFEPKMPEAERQQRLGAWRRAVEATIHMAGGAAPGMSEN